jgi:single-strand DNA-binding protein
VTEVIAANVEFIERKSESANRNQNYGQQYPGPDTGAAETGMAKSPMGGLGSDVPFDEEVPF